MALAIGLGLWLASPARAGTGSETVVDLIERFPVARVGQPVDELSFELGSDRQHLRAGWHPLRKDRKKRGYAWTRGRNAVIDLPIARPMDLRVALDVNGLSEPVKRLLPRQTLRILWNGHDLGSFPVAAQRRPLEFEVPARLQQRGDNRLELLPLYWVEPTAHPLMPDRLPVGVQVWSLRPTPARREVTPAPKPARTQGRSLFQAPGSVIGYAFTLPGDNDAEKGRATTALARTGSARLRGRGRLRHPAGMPPATADGEVTIALQSEGSPQRLLLRRSLDELRRNPFFEFDEDLSSLAGQAIRLTFAFSLFEWRAASPGRRLKKPRDLEIEWIEPRVTAEPGDAPEPVSGMKRRRYNVLMVVFDTLRSDHIEPYGGAPVRTPTLARLAESGVTFETAIANSSWTRPSVASLLSGLRPTAHRTLSKGERLAGGAKGDKLGSGVPYLPALLQAAGYHTVGVSDNGNISTSLGFSRGFDEFHERFAAARKVREEARSPEAAAQWVWTDFIAPALVNAGDDPFFLYLHEIDPHFPYDPAPPFDELYDFGYRGNITGHEKHIRQNLLVLRAANHYRGWLGEPELRRLRTLYDGEITAMDRYLGLILDRLRRRGLADDTLVIFLSDHGEEFMEHGTWGHGQHVYEEHLRVPLIFSLPGVLPAGRRPRVQAQLIDVAPTVLDLLGIAAPTMTQGMSLLPYFDSSAASPSPRAIISRSDTLNLEPGTPGRLVQVEDSLRRGEWKLVRHDYDFRVEGQYQYELYDLASDPGEKLDLWPQHPVLGDALAQELAWQHRLDRSLALEGESVRELDPKVRENLEALGYIE